MRTITNLMSITLCSIGVAVGVHSSAYAGQTEALMDERGRGEKFSAIAAIAINPWFGLGDQRWDIVYSELVDRIFLQEESGQFKPVQGVGLSDLMMISIKDDGPPSTPTPERPEIAALKQKILAKRDELKAESNSGKRALLAQDLEDLRGQLVAAEAEHPENPDAARASAAAQITKSIRKQVDKLKVRDNLLLAVGKPQLSELAFFKHWTTVELADKNCPRIDDENSIETLDLTGTVGRVGVFDVQRQWLVGPLLNPKESLKISTDNKSLLSLSGKQLFRISSIVVASNVEAQGSLPASFISRVSSGGLLSKGYYVGCVLMHAQKGLGFSTSAGWPVPTATGIAYSVPQVVGFGLVPIPAISSQ